MNDQTTQVEGVEPGVQGTGLSWRHRARPQTIALLAIALVFGLLLWAKLLLVTGHPRTALADPDAQQSSLADKPGEPETAAAIPSTSR